MKPEKPCNDWTPEDPRVCRAYVSDPEHWCAACLINDVEALRHHLQRVLDAERVIERAEAERDARDFLKAVSPQGESTS